MAGWEDMWRRNGGHKPGLAFDASEPLPFITTLFSKKLVPKGSGIIQGVVEVMRLVLLHEKEDQY